MYEFDQFIGDLREGIKAADFKAVQESVRRALHDKPFVADPTRMQVLHDEPGLMVLHAAVGAGFASPPHDHRTWAVIGVYSGQEDNTFYRLAGNSRAIEQIGGRSLRDHDVMMLQSDAIHKIANPRKETLLALHVYGVNILNIERSAWDPLTGKERPFDIKIGARGPIRS
jgi:predicted metal-dependent enzyme (double-stranded beta helix superfamily)